ncbi:MAG: GntR family transcriptional regulator [Lentisphaeria bacterium]|nr:GntR family transcriptional regulator [Lentisphaeria bacterium]
MKTKTADIENFLLQKIHSGEYAPESKLPSQHTLMQRFNCSRITVQRALSNLAAAGFIDAARGSGTFVRPGPYGQPVKEVIIVSESPASSRENYFAAMLYSLDTGTLPVHWINQQFINRHSEKFFVPGQLVIWMLPRERDISQMYYLQSKGIAQLLINRTYDDFNYVTTDSWAGISDGLEAFFADGANREIALVSGFPDDRVPFLQERLIAFYEECIRHQVNILPQWIGKFPYQEMQKDHKLIADRLFAGKRPPRKIFIPEESLIAPTIMAASKYQLQLNRDYQILVFGQGICIPEQPGLFMLHQPMHAFRREVERFIRRTVNGDTSPFRMRLATELHTWEE